MLAGDTFAQITGLVECSDPKTEQSERDGKRI